jgi:hypothetical protein
MSCSKPHGQDDLVMVCPGRPVIVRRFGALSIGFIAIANAHGGSLGPTPAGDISESWLLSSTGMSVEHPMLAVTRFDLARAPADGDGSVVSHQGTGS